MSKNIKILDCTLRDGGYVNSWRFGEYAIKDILTKLQLAGVDMIECGFVSQKKASNKDCSIFSTPSLDYVRHSEWLGCAACMINYGEYAIEDLPAYDKNSFVNTIRVAFHRKNLESALNYCQDIIGKGYKVFVQPMVTGTYSQEELDLLLGRANEMEASAVYIVDSFGTMHRNDVVRLFEIYDATLNKNIAIGFHSHNNLQLSFPNSLSLLERDTDRGLIIDSSVFGMGRGAGNLCTELMTSYLNDNYGKAYDLMPILEIVDNYLTPIYMSSPWGYSVPYYLASINNCHPNYAGYLMSKSTLGVKDINVILSQIPSQNKGNYDSSIVEQIYLNYQKCSIDDRSALTILRDRVMNRNIVLLAAGRSVLDYHDQIEKYIVDHNALVVSVNYNPEMYKADMVFVSNAKRYEMVTKHSGQIGQLVVTSNIGDVLPSTSLRVDYESLIDTAYAEPDNAGMMAIRLFIKLGVKHVALAGFDGYSTSPAKNYCSQEMILTASNKVADARNTAIDRQLTEMRKEINVEFITPTIYSKL